MRWVIIVVVLLVLTGGFVWLRQNVLDVAPPMPPVTDAIAPVEIFFKVERSDQAIPLAKIEKNAVGSLAVKSETLGYALLFAMNSAGALFPISKPTEVRPGAISSIQAYSKSEPYPLKVWSKDRAEQVVGGGVYYAIVVTKSKESLDRYVDWYSKYGSSWHFDGLPKVTKVYLAGN